VVPEGEEAMLNTVASIETPTSTVEVLSGDWPRPVELTWHDPHAVVTLLFRDADYEIEGRYQDGSASRRLDRVGKVFFVPPDAELYGWGTGGKIKAVRCVFDPAFYTRTLGRAGALTSAQLRRSLDLHGTLLPTLLTRLMEEALAPGLASVALAEALGTALVIECDRLMMGTVEDDRPRKAALTPRQHRIIEDYVASLEYEAPSVSALAAQCGLSERYFCQLFRAEMGQSAGRYLKAVQIDRAQNYLLNTNLPLKEIAFRLGFANAANFSAAFRATFHLPPLAFKLQYQEVRSFIRPAK
jgi:AraC family transcriptional regulator